MSRKLNIPNIDNLIKMYNSGISLNQISKESGFKRITLNRHFIENGVIMRTQSDSNKIKWSKMNQSQRKRQVQKAHEAVKGSKHSIQTKIKSAKSFYQNCLRCGMFESELAELLNKYFTVYQQFPIGIYNCDIAIHESPIIIEIQMSNRSGLKSKLSANRIKYILNKGYFVIYILSPSEHYRPVFDIFIIANKIISYVNILRSDKSYRGKYIMIGCDGNPFPSHRYDFNNFTRIE